MTKRWLVAAALITTLAGCAEPAPSPLSAHAPAEDAAPALESAGDAAAQPGRHARQARAAAGGTPAFVAAVQREFPALAVDRRDEELAAVAEQACADLTAGRDSATVLTGVRGLDPAAVDDRTARRLVRLAVGTVCPDQDRRVDEF
ncbi:DUF732 domain-containing protein [Actinoplanes sp. RD1]|uniref:DUF732 domain-containing protein n=1 Tax=Actinoplanes sp. RD1 TaxID=3064538 RepID=UPI0027405813|nr:DUF732 domain-containing protein [Actinoplanes sp. RD1]